MKITEITNQNKTIIILKNLDLNFSKLYPRIVELSKSLIANKSKLDTVTMTQMIGYLDRFIHEFNTLSQRILDTNFDSPDPDIKRIFKKIKKMKFNISQLRNLL